MTIFVTEIIPLAPSKIFYAICELISETNKRKRLQGTKHPPLIFKNSNMYDVINIQVTDEEVFPYYISIYNSMIGTAVDNQFVPSPLTNKELEIYAELMQFNSKFKQLPDQERADYLHSNTVRKKIREKCNIGTANYNNILGRLSQKITVFGNVLYNQGKLAPEFSKDINSYEGITFKFQKSIH